MDNLILTKEENGILTITLNRLEKKNALTSAMYLKLCDIFNSASQAQTIRCLVIQGDAHCFCAGNDLADFLNAKTDEELAEDLQKQPPPKTQMKDPLKEKLHPQVPKSRIIHFPLALENCGTLDGNIKILELFSDHLNLHKETINPMDLLSFDSKNVTYDLDESRKKRQFIDHVKHILNAEEDTQDNHSEGDEEMLNEFLSRYKSPYKNSLFI